jgi:hypothetical protein
MEYSQSRKEFIEKFRQSNNNTVNESRISTQPRGDLRIDTRWDYLHQLSKVKKNKFDQLRQTKEKDNLDKEMLECTFNPRLNKSKYVSNIGGLGHKSNTEENTNQPLFDRQENWKVKKFTKLEAVKNERFIKEFGQCYFSPKVVSKVIMMLELS